jgi:hypothetical protein
MVMGCDGDRYVYCFDEGKRPVARVVQLQQLARQLRLADAGYIASLARRGADGSLWSPPQRPARPARPPVIDRKRCTENPDGCGDLKAVTGSTLWLVETENSRGDYYHETRELWDPATREFVRIVGGKLVRTSQVPAGNDPETTDYAGLRVSTAGALSLRGVVFDPTRVLYAPKESGTTCGFSSGWRVPGPRG